MVANSISADLSRLYCDPFVGIPGIRVEEQSTRFIVRDHNGQRLAYVYFEDEPGRRSAAKLSCAALAVLKRLQLGPQVSRLSVTQVDGYKCQLALNSGRQNHFCVAARIPRVDLFIPQSPTEGNYTRPA
jgi:hypothetical protein